jgi:uncharacterized protein (TIGR02145 family)
LKRPIVKVLSEPAEGLGATFGINTTEPNDNGSIYRYEWTITTDPADGYQPVPTSVNSKMQEITVPYDDVERRYTAVARAIADGYNDPKESSEPVMTEVAGKFAPMYDILGENYYDIAVTQYDPGNYSYGIMEYRTPFALEANTDYTYKIVGTAGGGSPTFEWSVVNGEEYLEDFRAVDDSIFNIKFVDLSENLTIKGNPANNLIVELQCSVTINGAKKDYIKTIKIGDRDVCIPITGLTDAEGNEYSVYRFGNSGCWMTENLRSTKTRQNGIEVFVPKDKNSGNLNISAWYYPNGDDGGASLLEDHPEYGLLYSWPAANIGTVATESVDAFKIDANTGTNSDRQGICPAGWVLPSDWDWSMLEKEIASHPEYYSTKTAPYTNLENSVFYATNSLDWRPTTGRQDSYDNTYWGAKMKSPTAVGTTTNTYGFSNTDGTGFNALLVGNLVTGNPDYYGTNTYFWSSSSSNSTVAWRRCLVSSVSGSNRATSTKYNLFSVRCKKSDN